MSNPFQPIDAFKSPRFSQIATFMRLPHHRVAGDLDVALLGIPYDGGHVLPRGGAVRPARDPVPVGDDPPLEPRAQGLAVRGAPDRRLRRHRHLAGVDRADERDRPAGDRRDPERRMPARSRWAGITRSRSRSSGRWRKRHGPVALVHFDSHPDTWDQYFGSRYFHGTMFRRAVEERLIDPRRTFQIAIRGPLYGSDDFDFQAEHGMTVVRVEAIKERGVDWVVEQYAKLSGAKVYVSFDIDAVDPAYAPGTGTPEVGGLTSFEALSLVRGLRGLDFVGFDLVEVAPQYDGAGQITALLAANLLFEFLSLVALNK